MTVDRHTDLAARAIAAAEQGAREADTTRARAARDEARALLAAATDRAARDLQGKGYAVLTRHATAYQAGAGGPEPVVEFVVTNPHQGGQIAAQFVATAASAPRLAQIVAATAHAALSIVLPGQQR